MKKKLIVTLLQQYFKARSSFVLALALLVSSCVSRAEIEEMKENQQKILSKLEQIEKIAQRPAAAAPPAAAPSGPDASKVYALQLGNAATHGHKDAWVTIVEISDFQCPFCSRAYNTMKALSETYGEDLRLVFKHNPLPFHDRAMPAALAAECAKDQGKFWQLHDKLFDNQRALDDASIERYAQEVSLDIGKFKKCIEENKHVESIKNDQSQAAQFGARGTPAFFINGRFISGAQPIEVFKGIVEEELRKAKQSGIPKKDFYSKVVEERGSKTL